MHDFWLENPFLYDLIQILATGGFLKRVLPKLNFILRKKERKILDIGCGTGTLAKYLSGDYFGVDINPKFIEFAKRKFPQLRFQVLDAVEKNLPNENFDYVIIMNVLHHLTDNEVVKLFEKIKKYKRTKELVIIESKPEGLIGNILGKFDAGSNFRKFNYLESIIEAYFRIKKLTYAKAPFGTYKYLIARCLLS